MSIVTNTALRKALTGVADNIAEQLRHLRGRNLLLATQPTQISNTDYEMAEFKLAEAPADGETFTISMIAELGSDRTQFYFYNSGGNVPLVSSKVVDGRVEATFRWASCNSSGTTADNTSVRIYQYPRTGTSASVISHVKLERGSIATEWCRADEDFVPNPVACFDYLYTTAATQLLQDGEAPAGAQICFDNKSYKRFFAVKDGKYYGRWKGCEQLGVPYGLSKGTDNGRISMADSGVTPQLGRLYVCKGSGYAYVLYEAGGGLEAIYSPVE